MIWKLHKAASATGVRSRPIAAAVKYITGPICHFLHSQLMKDVWKHKFVLKDSLELIRMIEEGSIHCTEHTVLTAADVNALYPSIRLDQGMRALTWFMDAHTTFNETLKDVCLKAAYFVLTNNYVECSEVPAAIYHQRIGTAMGTSFSVVYAMIFMIWLEAPIVEDVRFAPYIELYKRFIDDLILMWNGSAELLCEFRQCLGSADEFIKLDWNGYTSPSDSVNVEIVKRTNHRQVDMPIFRSTLSMDDIRSEDG